MVRPQLTVTKLILSRRKWDKSQDCQIMERRRPKWLSCLLQDISEMVKHKSEDSSHARRRLDEFCFYIPNQICLWDLTEMSHPTFYQVQYRRLCQSRNVVPNVYQNRSKLWYSLQSRQYSLTTSTKTPLIHNVVIPKVLKHCFNGIIITCTVTRFQPVLCSMGVPGTVLQVSYRWTE